jgi:hypothetical protein
MRILSWVDQYCNYVDITGQAVSSICITLITVIEINKKIETLQTKSFGRLIEW